jgi:hypothetical protein
LLRGAEIGISELDDLASGAKPLAIPALHLGLRQRVRLWRPAGGLKAAVVKSGNPNGRPAVVKNVQALAREHTEAAVSALVAALEKPAERVQAANVLLAYGYGRPVQTQNVRVIPSMVDLTTEELKALARGGQEAIEGEAEEADEDGE